jgi:hypothetical protein
MTKSNYITRYIEASVTDDLSRKMVFIGGPRQAGRRRWQSICVNWQVAIFQTDI